MDKTLLKRTLLVIGIPTLYAVILRLFFGVHTWRDLYSVMSISFLFCLPTIVGALTIYFSSADKVRKFAYRFFIPWIPILIFAVLTLAFYLEGWACWLMVLPLFLLAASIGGLIGGYFLADGVASGMNFNVQHFSLPPITLILQVFSALLAPLLRRELKAADIWLVALSLGLLLGSKTTGIVVALLLGVPALVTFASLKLRGNWRATPNAVAWVWAFAAVA